MNKEKCRTPDNALSKNCSTLIPGPALDIIVYTVYKKIWNIIRDILVTFKNKFQNLKEEILQSLLLRNSKDPDEH